MPLQLSSTLLPQISGEPGETLASASLQSTPWTLGCGVGQKPSPSPSQPGTQRRQPLPKARHLPGVPEPGTIGLALSRQVMVASQLASQSAQTAFTQASAAAQSAS